MSTFITPSHERILWTQKWLSYSRCLTLLTLEFSRNFLNSVLLGSISKPSTSWAISTSLPTTACNGSSQSPCLYLNPPRICQPGPELPGMFASLSSPIPSEDWLSWCLLPWWNSNLPWTTQGWEATPSWTRLPTGTDLLLTASSRMHAPALRYSSC